MVLVIPVKPDRMGSYQGYPFFGWLAVMDSVVGSFGLYGGNLWLVLWAVMDSPYDFRMWYDKNDET